ncbi:hypothetical protein GCM10020000_87750 [Streptomyces olivoverticillatus]
MADLFTLDHAQLAAASGSTKRADKLAEQIAQAKHQPLHRVFCALGVLGTGRTMSRRIAGHFGTMDAIRAADAAALTQVDGIGPEKAPVIAAQVAELGPVIDKLTAAGVNMNEPRESGEGAGAGPLAGKAVVVTGGMTGALESFKRHDMEELIRRAGGEPSGSVSKKTSLVVAGEKAGSKKAKAESLGIEVLTPPRRSPSSSPTTSADAVPSGPWRGSRRRARAPRRRRGASTPLPATARAAWARAAGRLRQVAEAVLDGTTGHLILEPFGPGHVRR